MLNSPDTYAEQGQKAAVARNECDEARYNFHRRWFNRARAMEKDGPDRRSAEQAWDLGYKSKRVLPVFKPFA